MAKVSDEQPKVASDVQVRLDRALARLEGAKRELREARAEVKSATAARMRELDLW